MKQIIVSLGAASAILCKYFCIWEILKSTQLKIIMNTLSIQSMEFIQDHQLL